MPIIYLVLALVSTAAFCADDKEQRLIEALSTLETASQASMLDGRQRADMKLVSDTLQVGTKQLMPEHTSYTFTDIGSLGERVDTALATLASLHEEIGIGESQYRHIDTLARHATGKSIASLQDPVAARRILAAELETFLHLNGFSSIKAYPPFLQNTYNIFRSHAVDGKFNRRQAEAYENLAQLTRRVMRLFNPDSEPQAKITLYRPDLDLNYSSDCAIRGLKNAHAEASRALKQPLTLLFDDIENRVRELRSALSEPVLHTGSRGQTTLDNIVHPVQPGEGLETSVPVSSSSSLRGKRSQPTIDQFFQPLSESDDQTICIP